MTAITFPTQDQMEQAGRNHYYDGPELPVFFYGGAFSNFVASTSTSMTITAAQPWLPPETHYRAEYHTVEHFFAASKATYQEAHDFVRTKWTPYEAKSAGRHVALRPGWDDGVSFQYMLIGLKEKFAVPSFREFLVGTEHRFIAEDSPTDKIWGIRTGHASFGGRNLLGLALMLLRAHYRSESLDELAVFSKESYDIIEIAREVFA